VPSVPGAAETAAGNPHASLVAMFTGLVRERGRVTAVEGGAGGVRLRIAVPRTATGVTVGDSVAIGGVCLTVVEIAGAELAFDAVPETLSRTALARLVAGDEVNVEPAVRAGEPLGATSCRATSTRSAASARRGRKATAGGSGWTRRRTFLRYCVEKGSVAVDGVSLTVAALDRAGFAVALVPHTLAETTLGALAPEDDVNLEADVIAKYVERLLPGSTMTP